jgi:hypothetical protein
VKLCKDCKHAVPDDTFNRVTRWLRAPTNIPTENSWKYAHCGHPNGQDQSYALVNGQTEKHACASMRRDHFIYTKHGDARNDSTCGKDAHWFEPREEKAAA